MARGLASYDEILRLTVPEPDFSFRPSREEEALSLHRFGEPTEHRPHWLTPEERETLTRVASALTADGTLELSGIEVEIDFRTIILTGRVPGPSTKVRIEAIAVSVTGVDRVDNQLEVRSRNA